MDNIGETTKAAIAGVATKSTVAGAGVGTVGWLTSDRLVALGGLVVAILGFVVNALFRWLDRIDKRRQMQRQAERGRLEDERSKELHELKLKVLRAHLSAGTGDGAVDAVGDVTS